MFLPRTNIDPRFLATPKGTSDKPHTSKYFRGAKCQTSGGPYSSNMEGSDLFFRSVFSITTVHIHPQKKPIQKGYHSEGFSSLSEFKKNTLQCLTQNSTNNNLFELSEMFNVFKDSLSFPLIISLWLRSVKRLCMAGGLKDYKHLGFVWICEFYPGLWKVL